jgi:hypothetical protein
MRSFARNPAQSRLGVPSARERTSTATKVPSSHTPPRRAVSSEPHRRSQDVSSPGMSAIPATGHDFSRLPIYAAGTGPVGAPLSINAPGDVYEQEADRVADEVSRSTGPRDSRSLSRVDDSPAADTVGAPPVVHEVLRTPGRPLEPAALAGVGAHFGHDLSRVRVHTDAKAAESARAVDARAYTVGSDIVFGAGQYAPDTPDGSRVLAHELVHVGQQSQAGGAAPRRLQRVGLFESVARFFGGGTFTERELKVYIERLRGTGHIEDHYDSDNKAREVVRRGLHKGEPLKIRTLLIQEMLSGHVAGDDKEGILTILEEKTTSRDDLERLVDAVGIEVLVDAFGDGDEADRLFLLLGEIAKHRGDPVNTDWYVSFSAIGAEELRPPRFGLVVDALTVQPTSDPNPITVVKAATNPNISGAPVPIKTGVTHPRDAVGQGFMGFHVAPVQQDGSVPTDLVQAPTQRNAKYGPVTRDRRQVYAHVDLRFGRQQVGAEARGTRTGTVQSDEVEETKKRTQEVQTTAGRKKTATRSATDSREAAEAREQMRSRGTAKKEEHITDTVVDLKFNATGDLKTKITVSPELSTDGELLALILLAAGPEGAALYELLKLTGSLKSTKFKVSGTAEVGYSVHLQLDAEVYKRWIDKKTEMEHEESGDINRREDRARAERGASATDEASASRSRTSGAEQSRTVRHKTTTSAEETEDQSRAKFQPVVEDASVSFEVR